MDGRAACLTGAVGATLSAMILCSGPAEALRYFTHNSSSPPGHWVVARASWYGPGFYGHRTASGARFDGHEMTAASKTLPFGTKVLVHDLRTGRTCTVTINDRGPYVAGRALDLSPAAAHAIGMGGVDPIAYLPEAGGPIGWSYYPRAGFYGGRSFAGPTRMLAPHWFEQSCRALAVRSIHNPFRLRGMGGLPSPALAYRLPPAPRPRSAPPPRFQAVPAPSTPSPAAQRVEAPAPVFYSASRQLATRSLSNPYHLRGMGLFHRSRSLLASAPPAVAVPLHRGGTLLKRTGVRAYHHATRYATTALGVARRVGHQLLAVLP